MKKTNLLLAAICAATAIGFSTSCSNQNDNVLIVGMECNYSPFNWTAVSEDEYTLPISNAKGQFADGYDVQIARYLGEQLDMEVQIMKFEWDSLTTAVNTNMINCIIAGMSYTEERDLVLDFTRNYYLSEMTMIVRKSDSLASATSIQDFSGKKVGSQLGTLTDTIIDQINGVIHSDPYNSFGTAATAVSSGQIDAMTAEYPVAVAICNADPSLTIVSFDAEKGFAGLDENELGVAVAVKEGNKELQGKIDSALATLSLEDQRSMMSSAISRAPASEE
ncbi:MAG: transporter substrate-binding domain-containing protein [Bacilli bacterium]